MSNELKPCPFCGGEAREYSDCAQPNEILHYWIDCDNDGCDIEVSTKRYYSESEALEKWNKRHSIDSEQEQRDNLERHNEKVRGDHECRCYKCHMKDRSIPAFMSVCNYCGNKRCPKGTDHDLDCTNSNECGQKGSRYELGIKSEDLS